MQEPGVYAVTLGASLLRGPASCWAALKLPFRPGTLEDGGTGVLNGKGASQVRRDPAHPLRIHLNIHWPGHHLNMAAFLVF